MVETRILMAGMWTALMLTYLLGDVLRIFSGAYKPGEIGGMVMTQGAWLGISILMLIPIVTLVLSLILPQATARWVCIGAAAFLFIFNIIGLPSYEMTFDKFLIAVGLAINGLTIWYAWNWIQPPGLSF